MKALITGASSGIGMEFAKILDEMGYETIVVARREEKLLKLKEELLNECTVIRKDLSKEEEVISLYEMVKDEDIHIVINNAGFGLFGEFKDTDLEKELEMIRLNISALHILTKYFIRDFKDKKRGYILNVASSASFLPGPLMSTYYATKAYVQRLTLAISEELKKDRSFVYVGALCPGPVETEFNGVANVSFNLKSLSKEYVARYALKKMFQGKRIIIPGKTIKLGVFFQRFLPYNILLKISYRIQKKKS